MAITLKCYKYSGNPKRINKDGLLTGEKTKTCTVKEIMNIMNPVFYLEYLVASAVHSWESRGQRGDLAPSGRSPLAPSRSSPASPSFSRCCSTCLARSISHLRLALIGASAVKNSPTTAGDIGLIPGLGRSHMLQSNKARAPQLTNEPAL